MPQSTPNAAAYRGIPLRDRSEAHVRDALAAYDAEVVASFLRLWRYAQEHALGLSKLARQAQIGDSILSQCYNGTYEGQVPEIANRIEAFFYRLDQQEKYGGLRAFCDTALASALWAVMDKTRVTRKIQVIQGPEQIGKSRSASEYAERNNAGRTRLIELPGGTCSGLGLFINDLADSLGIAYSCKSSEKRLRIKHSLETCDLLIIDEAHLLFRWTDRAQADWWDYLRTDLYANGKRGIVMMVTNCEMLSGLQAWRRRTGYNIGQLLGRMHLEPIRIDPVEDLIEDDISALVGRYYADGKPRAATLRTLHKLAVAQPGHLAFIVDACNEAWTTAKARRKAIDDDLILQVAERMCAETSKRKDLYQ